jgi:hypothetical protein
MNFFGHAALAADHFKRENPNPEAGTLGRLCVGAMLPDFVGMLRLGKPHVTDEALERGVSFHHRTDHAFHDLPSFQQLSRQTFAWLTQSSLPRGPARAVAHVGIEMLLDEVMARDAAAREAYLLALSVPLNQALSFDAPGDFERLETLRRNLSERAATQLGTTAEVVALRIRRTLEGRPRLATDDAGERLLREWVAVARPWVAAEAPRLLASLRAVLADQARAE